MKKFWTYTECYVKELYEQLAIFSPEQLNLKAIAKKLDIKIFYWEEKSQAIIYDTMSAIFIDLRNSLERQWQDFCHELAHVLLHIGIQDKLPQMYIEYQEHKANQFMYHAAIPTFMLDNLDSTSYTAIKIAAVFGVELEFAQHRLDHYIAQQHQFNMPIWNT
ncbi:ImmA/IrrE family metallo-endopeptidase [Solibacillus sp.]|uniref:ImmA/IrrE family metallo-endopeptidase n=1 Tax=Solibacillus sp. TaxID=1909654 RepID=UPI0033148039